MLDYAIKLLFVHLVTDFMMLKEKMGIDMRSKDRYIKHQAVGKHCAVFLLLGLLLFAENGYTLANVLGLILLSGSHYLVDWLIISLEGKFSELRLFLMDQAAHLTAISFFLLYFSADAVFTLSTVVTDSLNAYGIKADINIFQKALIVISVIIITTSAGNKFIRLFLSNLKTAIMADAEVNENRMKMVKMGRYIGSIERLLTILGILSGAYEAIAALYVSKTAIRFGEAKSEPQFAEYYILGTSLSALYGVTIGVIIKLVLVSF